MKPETTVILSSYFVGAMTFTGQWKCVFCPVKEIQVFLLKNKKVLVNFPNTLYV